MFMQNVIIDDYERLEKRFFTTFKDKNYMFEITKCCGYSEIVSCTKDDTLRKLHENVGSVFGKKIKLYILNVNEKIWIPDSQDITVKNYLKETTNLRPEYPMPANIVYKIYLDDGSCHLDHYQKPAIPRMINVCMTCRIHEN